MARNDPGNTGPGSIAEAVARLTLWARHTPRGFARVEYYSEYARAETDRRLGEALLRAQVPYHRVELPVRVGPSRAGRHLLEHLEKIESGTVSITGFATAVADAEFRDFLAILSVRREVLAELRLNLIWWLTPNFVDALIKIAPDLDSWFMERIKIDEDFRSATGESDVAEMHRPTGPAYRIDEARVRAADLVERIERTKSDRAHDPGLVELVASASDAIVDVGAPSMTSGLADRLVRKLAELYPGRLAEGLTTLRSLNALARLLATVGRYEEATVLIDRAQARVDREELDDRPDVARDLHNLALLHLDANRPEQAEVLARRALAIAERVHGPNHPNTARCLMAAMGVLRETGRLEEAEAMCRRAIAIDEKAYGPDNPEIATDLNNLAVLLRASGRLDEAEPMYRRALAIEERCFGPDHPAVTTVLDNLGILLGSMNRFDEAEPLLRRALSIDENALGPDHPVVAADLVHLASVLQGTGRLAEAEPLLRRALEIDQKIHEPGHPSIARDRDRLASLLKDMGNREGRES